MENLAKIWRIPELNDLELLQAKSVNHSYARHWHDTFVIEIVESGANGFYCEGKTYEASEGSIIAINPGQVHTGYPLGSTPLVYRSIYPHPEHLTNLIAESDTVPHFLNPVIADSVLSNKLHKLHRTLETSSDALEIESMFVSVISTLLRKHTSVRRNDSTAPNKNAAVKRVHDYLSEHYKSEVTLRDLAELSGLTSFHLLRSFRKAYGLPPFGFLMNLRIERAKELLRRDSSISEVAQDLGFYDQSHLNRHFVKITGVTPGRYRAISSKKSETAHDIISLNPNRSGHHAKNFKLLRLE